MSNDSQDRHDRNTGKGQNQDKIVMADDDNIPHLENMANVQGSNKNSDGNNSTRSKNVEKEAGSSADTA